MMKRTLSRRGAAIVAAAALAATGVMAAAPAAHAQEPAPPPDAEPSADEPEPDAKDVPASPTGAYVVVLDGGALVEDFPKGELRSSAADAQGASLEQAHDQLLSEVGVGADQKLHSYEYAMNGFAAVMTQEQAEKLAGKQGVALVIPDELRQLETDASGKFLGLSGKQGVWATTATGEDVVIGVIDSGIWPEHPSLADDGSYSDLGIDVPCEFGTTTHELADGFYDDPFECNNKLIGARQIMTSYETFTGLTDVEYDSARDENGHGTHTATTAAGNANVRASIYGIPRGKVTGIAPRARVIAYKALGELGGYGSDLAAAIDQAVADGVDVINYSIGSSSFAIGPDDVAFLFAADAGVHVATSNGNSGPGAATIGSPSSVPWLTSVGASTHDRTFQGEVTVSDGRPWSWWVPWWPWGTEDQLASDLGSGPEGGHGRWPRPSRPEPLTVAGASVTPGTRLLEIVDAEALGNPLCLPDQPFNGKVKGKIVLCARGEIARVDKSLAVGMARGAGMVLYNENDAQALVTDSHWVPSVHVSYSEGLAIKDYIASARKPAAQIAGGQAVPIPGNWMADFSSRGPNRLSDDIIKPDVTAPGVNILAGNTPTPTTGSPGDLFQSISGTSMSSPHVAGLMALLDQVHPDWTPSMVKSAIMTTARQDVVKEDGATPADAFDFGAGHVVPNAMFNPGVVYDAGWLDWLGFTCGADLGLVSPAGCASIGIDASDFNQASIGIGALPGSQTVTRTVTNVSGAPLTLAPVFSGLDGVSATVDPAVIEVAPGATASFDVTFAVGSAPLDQWVFGALTLEGGGFAARSPIALRPVEVGIPDAVSGTIESGGVDFGVDFGYSGAYGAVGHGLAPVDASTSTIAQDPDQIFDPSDVGNGAELFEITVTDATLLRIHLPQVDPNDDIDLDLFVFAPDGTEYSSTNGGTNETVDVAFPAAGTYQAYVHGWGVGDTPVEYTFQSWVVPSTTDGSLAVSAPTQAVVGTTGTVSATWPMDLDPSEYLGAVAHTTPSGETLTVVEVFPAG